jgi:CP family cyanate transporter-like MFS transporter
VAWSVTSFFALQSAGFYATLAWLPSVFHSHGLSTTESGLLLSLALVVGLVPALTLPSLAARVHDQRVFMVAVMVSIAAGWLGVLLAPTSLPYLWVILLGLGQNAAFPLALTLIVLRGGHLTAGLSTLAQSVGYLVAALGPLGIGIVHDVSGSWTPPIIVLLALLVPQIFVGLAAARNRMVASAVA